MEVAGLCGRGAAAARAVKHPTANPDAYPGRPSRPGRPAQRPSRSGERRSRTPRPRPGTRARAGVALRSPVSAPHRRGRGKVRPLGTDQPSTSRRRGITSE